jgi:alkanesulfonate monooxygenase SsuD/methylene tetrahydromethanopterin reductase-like flavin-dependent oxidoreductase (luciferase family)
LELGGYRVPVEQKRDQWREAVEQCANMLAMDPYPGFEGQFFSMPTRNIVPKPVQRPHPPLWVACSNRETIKLAARLGIGALTFAFVDPAEATQWVDDYYRIFKEECVPIGHAVNPNIGMVSSFGIHQDTEEARRRFQEGFRFFQFALGWHYGFGEQIPGRTNIWELFQQAQVNLPVGEAGTLAGAAEGGISTPEGLREHLRKFDACGVDQVTFIQQAGRNKHEHICEALELFAGEVMGEFKEREAERVKQKAEDLAPFVEAAFKRKQWMKPLADDEIPPVIALGRQVAEQAAKAGQPLPVNPNRAAWVKALEDADAKK